MCIVETAPDDAPRPHHSGGDSYNVLFDQITFQLGTVEIVMYNPRDRQAIASHALIDGNRRCSGADYIMLIQLSPEGEKQAMISLRRFCAEELEVELSELQARQFLKFVLQEIAPTAFNAGVAAAETYLRDRVADLEGVCHVPEFAYWPKGTSVRRK